MNRAPHLLLVVGLIIVAISFGIYHFANAQTNSPNTNEGGNNTQPENKTPELNNTHGNNNTTENFNNWTIISGNWTLSNDNLNGNSPENSTLLLPNIILYPEPQESATKVSTLFEVKDLDSTVANYVWILYSFIDPSTYKLAGINIFKNSVYAVGYVMNDDNLVAEPFWPGIPSNLTYTPGSVYNLTLAKDATSLNLLINGTEYMTQNIGNERFDLDKVGLSYGRIKDISFLSYETETFNQ